MSKGVVLDDGVRTLPCVINVVVDEPGRTVMEITLKEGRNRQIRRMCEAVGLEVVRLKRSAEGSVKLGMLQPGQYRELTKQELTALRAAAVKGRDRSRTMREQAAAEARRQPAARKPRTAEDSGPRSARSKNGDAPRYGKPAPRTDDRRNSRSESRGPVGSGRGPSRGNGGRGSGQR